MIINTIIFVYRKIYSRIIIISYFKCKSIMIYIKNIYKQIIHLIYIIYIYIYIETVTIIIMD